MAYSSKSFRVFDSTTAMAVFLFLVIPRWNDAEVLSGLFVKTSKAGQPVRMYKTLLYTESCFQCSLVCLRETVATPSRVCIAFGCHSSMKCDLYTTEVSTTLTEPDIPLFWLNVTDLFQTITVQGYSYSIYMSTVRMNYHEAKRHCNELGGYLLQFDSLLEYDAVATIALTRSESRSWVGANDLQTEGQWVTDREGTELDPDLWLWRKTEPNNAHGDREEDCAVINHPDNTLNDILCSKVATFLCQRDV